MSASSASTLPLGVAILSVLIGLFGAILLVAGILIVLAIGLGSASAFAAFGISFLGGVLLLIFGIIVLAVARGLWDQELWALVVSLIVFGLMLLSDIVRLDFGLGALILLVLVVYLAAVHNHFT